MSGLVVLAARKTLLWIWAILAIGISLASLRYLGGDPGVAPPELRPSAVKNMYLFIAHAGGAGLALLILPAQVLLARRNTSKSLHQWLGRAYVGGVTLAGLAGLRLAAESFAGWPATLGFTCLAVAWLSCTWLGWSAARRTDRSAHMAWMVRSAALTSAALTLRIYLPIPPALGFDYADGYRLIAWICWMPNLALAEWWIQSRASQSVKRSDRASAALLQLR